MYVITQMESDIPRVPESNEAMCIGCQHCLAVCPVEALSIFGRDPADSLPVRDNSGPDFEQMNYLMRSRRSIRSYKKQNVDRQLIHKLLHTVANAPTGANSRGLRFRVLDDMDALSRFRLRVMETLKDAQENKVIPASMAYLEMLLPLYHEKRIDVIFRGAPHLLVVSASTQSVSVTENVPIALSYFELLAQSAGLGTVWCGLVKMALETVPALKQEIGLPADEHYYPMLFGYPAVSFARTVQRDEAAEIISIEIP
jgi:nitroreductase